MKCSVCEDKYRGGLRAGLMCPVCARSELPPLGCSTCADTPCHECGSEMEGEESYRYEDDNGGDESWLCPKCHDDYQKAPIS